VNEGEPDGLACSCSLEIPLGDAVMSDWGQGYHVGSPYTVGFYPELAPNHLESALLFAGFKADLTKAGAAYCELGCGYGLTTLILAASNPQTSFVGVDFNPTHIVAARALVESARLPNICFIEASFDELLEPRFADLGDFDVIALHGIYSWVAPSIRRAIVEFADARLKTGGALYVSYNAAPGWMPRAPLQRFIFEYAKRHPKGPLATTAEALRFAKTIKDAGAIYFQANPPVGAFIEAMQGLDLTYLVHENLNESWSALYHADVVADFASTRLSYACAAHIADDIDETSIPITTHDVVAGITDRVWHETVKDFLVGRSFRRDIFVRGPVQLTPAERTEELDDRNLVLTVLRSAATANIKTAMGEVKGRADIYSPILDRLAAGPVRLSQLIAQLGGSDGTAATVIQALGLLIHSGQVKMVRADTKTDPEPARRLNVALARQIAAGRSVRVLAAPAVRTGVGADLCDFGFVTAREKDLWLDAETIARTTWKMIENTSIRPMRDGKLYREDSEAVAYLHEAAELLLAEKQGLFETLGI
jgi:SAM-dependent methyltransferase